MNIENPQDSEKSSISSQMDYVEICRQAVLDDAIFEQFKSSTQYRAVLEHVDYSQGTSYFELIRNNPEIIKNLSEMKAQELGNPYRYWYQGLGLISPTQIRYAKVLQDLEILFGDLHQLQIAEIGAGYGGQAAHILNRWKVSKYSIFDLKWPGMLTEKYFQKLKIAPVCVPTIAALPSDSSFDLVISNYAFSELFREIQDSYLSNVILNSKRGYLIYNQIHENSNNSYSPEEFASLIPGAEVFEEIPNTFVGNVLIVWGHQKEMLPTNLFVRK
jgi:putative sugar O-methyltransferase